MLQGPVKMVTPPILDNKNTSSPSIFVPSALLREARRQKNLPNVPVPPVCLLDPDGDPSLVERAAKATSKDGPRVVVGGTWTTDAPFRETAEAIEAARSKGILGVEMEAAALYTFARSVGVSVLCLAHVTNTMGQGGADFEKGEADGTSDALALLEGVVAALHPVD